MSTNLIVPSAVAWAKYSANMVKSDCPPILRDLGKRITAHLERERKATEKAEQHRIAAAQHLKQARDLCDDDDSFTAFHEKFCSDLGRSRAYELLAIATGKTSIEDIRASTRERVARHRAKTTDVTDSESVTLPEPVTDSEFVTSPEPVMVAAPTAVPEPTDKTDDASIDPVILRDWKTGEEYVESDGAAKVIAPASLTAPAGLTAPKSKPNKPSLVESWEASEEDRATIRDLVLEDYFATADGRHILSLIRGIRRDVVIGDLLDALGVDGMRKAMSTEFSEQLLAKLNPKKPKPIEHAVQTGTDADGKPIFALKGRGERSRAH